MSRFGNAAERPQPANEGEVRRSDEPRRTGSSGDGSARRGRRGVRRAGWTVLRPGGRVAGEERRVEHERPAAGGERAQALRVRVRPASRIAEDDERRHSGPHDADEQQHDERRSQPSAGAPPEAPPRERATSAPSRGQCRRARAGGSQLEVEQRWRCPTRRDTRRAPSTSPRGATCAHRRYRQAAMPRPTSTRGERREAGRTAIAGGRSRALDRVVDLPRVIGAEASSRATEAEAVDASGDAERVAAPTP